MIDPKLMTIMDRVRTTQAQSNPSPEDEVTPDAGWLLQLELLRSGDKDSFSEDELIEALIALGVPEDDVASWFEDLASYL
jgi:hypothetical protein